LNELFGPDYFLTGKGSSDNSQDQINLDTFGKRSLAVASLGDMRAESENPAEAFVLWMKALGMLQNLIQTARKISQGNADIAMNNGNSND
jgi:hypothetical protein